MQMLDCQIEVIQRAMMHPPTNQVELFLNTIQPHSRYLTTTWVTFRTISDTLRVGRQIIFLIQIDGRTLVSRRISKRNDVIKCFSPTSAATLTFL